MGKYILKRILLMIASLFIIMTMLFILIRLIPNQVQATQGGYDKALSDMREAWGYNKPIMVQYGIFLKHVFTRFDWGFCTTMGTYLQPVTSYIAGRLPATIYINVLSLIISVPLGIVLGIAAAVNKGKWQDGALQAFIMFFISVPAFVYAFLLQYIVGFRLNLCPLIMKSGTDYFSWRMFRSAIMPVVALSLGPIAGDMRLVRAELTETLTSDYMLLARTKGLTRREATMRHAFRNSMVPLLPSYLADFISILGGSMIIEQIFAVPGIGKTYVNSIMAKDYSVFLACSMFYVVIGLAAGIITDLSYGFIDPRIRMGGDKSNAL